MKACVVALSLIFLVTGCSNFGSKKTQLDNRIAVYDKKEDVAVQRFVTGAVDSLSLVPNTNKQTEVALAERFVRDAQDLVGTPPVGQRFNVPAMVTTNAAERAVALRVLTQQEKQLIDDYLRKQQLVTKLDAAEDKLIEKGIIKEKEDNSNIVKRVWRWLMATVGLGGIIALCVLVPGALPILGQVFAWIISKIPKLISFFGVVGQATIQNVVSGVSDFKAAIKNIPEGTALTKEQVLSLHSKALSNATTPADQHIISVLRDKNQQALSAAVLSSVKNQLGQLNASDIPHPQDVKIVSSNSQSSTS